MSYRATVYRVFVASPSDTQPERVAVRDVLERWNASNAMARKVILEPVTWESHSTPSMSSRPQSVINDQLVHTCDMAISIFWTRLGTRTSEAESGTAEEITLFRDAGKPVLIYFSSCPVVLEGLDLEEYRRLTEFRKKCESEGLFRKYNDLNEFRTLLQGHVASVVDVLQAREDRELLRETKNPVEQPVRDAPASALITNTLPDSTAPTLESKKPILNRESHIIYRPPHLNKGSKI